MEAIPSTNEAEDAVRFEDLTVDDDLPIIDRIVHYSSSQIALQRLVHIKMLAETSKLAGYVQQRRSTGSVVFAAAKRVTS